MVILRYAHAFAGGGGGVEQHLEHLDRELLKRNEWTIIRLLLSGQNSEIVTTEESVGRGRLIRVILPVAGKEVPELLRDDTEDHTSHGVSAFVRDHILCAFPVWQVYGRRLTLRRKIRRRAGEPANLYSLTSSLITSYAVNLVVLHFQGGADAEDVLSAARDRGVPVALVNHFANQRFSHLSMRKHILLAQAIAGVSGIGVPRHLRGRFVNVSNGIDTRFFSPAALAADVQPGQPPVLLLPARIVRNKGHLDLVSAAAEIEKQGIDFAIHFAGREEPGAFALELKRKIDQFGLSSRVKFLGTLDQQALRSAYFTAKIVVLPTYHHEGLPRVLIEAQAMGTPVVTYATGGAADAVIDRKTGFLLETGDLTGLQKTLVAILKDPQLRTTLGSAGREFVQSRYTLEALASRHERYYTDTISSFQSK